MKISIITVTLGRPQLEDCIETVQDCRHMHSDFEHLILVDKKAEEGTYEAVCQLASEYENVRVSETRHDGIFDGWNKALKEITGDIVMFLGDDDLVIGFDTFKAVSDMFEKNPNVKWVYGDYMLNGDVFKAGIYNYRRLIEVNFIGTMSTYFKREVFTEFGDFDQAKWPHSADYEYSLRIGHKYPAKYIPIVLSYFNWNKGSMSHDDNPEQAKETELMQEEYRRKYEDTMPAV